MRHLALFVPFTFVTQLAQAQIIEINEWDNRSRPGWDYLNAGLPSIDPATNSPSGGGGLKFTYQPGDNCTSQTGGIAGYNFSAPVKEFYVGHWVKWSSNWVWHPEASKIDYIWSAPLPGSHNDNMLTSVEYGGGSMRNTMQRVWDTGSCNMCVNNSCGSCSSPPSLSELPGGKLIPGNWYWYELHLKINTPGEYDGIFEQWFGDPSTGQTITVVSDFAVGYSPAGAAGHWILFQHSPEYGGIQCHNIPETQYIWMDHTVISTQPIGMPGGAPPPPPTCIPQPENCANTIDDDCDGVINNGCGVTPPPGQIGTVTDLDVVSSNASSATLQFTEVDDGSGSPVKYDVRYRVPPMLNNWGNATVVTLGTCASPVAGGTQGAQKTCTVDGLNLNTAYEFQLVAYTGTLNQNAQFGALSNIASGTTSSVNNPPPPSPGGDSDTPPPVGDSDNVISGNGTCEETAQGTHCVGTVSGCSAAQSPYPTVISLIPLWVLRKRRERTSPSV